MTVARTTPQAFSDPTPEAGSDPAPARTPGWTPVCELDAVPRGDGVAALLDGEVQVAIFRTDDDTVHALSNIDPFSDAAVLSRGIVGEHAGVPIVASPVYKHRFDLRSGVCLDDETVRVPTFPVRVTDGLVHVGTP